MGIEAVLGDITLQEVDAVVNAANSSLLGGGGVDGAIHRAAGPRLLEACRSLRAARLPDGLPVGQAVATPGFDLPATWVIHTVGPNRYAGQSDPALLRSAFDTSLETAQGLGCSSVALPAVSAGAYGWDAEVVARTAVASARAHLGGPDAHADSGTHAGSGAHAGSDPDRAPDRAPGTGTGQGSSLRLIRFVLFSPALLRAFERALGDPGGR